VSRAERLSRVVAYTTPENHDMRSLLEHFGFAARLTDDLRILTAALKL